MESIKPLTPLIATSTHISELIAPPYDIVNHQQVRQYLSEKPNANLGVTRPDGWFSDAESSPSQKYTKSTQVLKHLVADFFHQTAGPCYLLYTIETSVGKQTGSFCLANTQRLKKHELTREAKIQDRIGLNQSLKTQVSPVMLCTAPQKQLSKLLDKLTSTIEPVLDTEYQDQRHTLAIIDEPESIDNINKIFTHDMPIYIADGHHHCQTQLTCHQTANDIFSPYVLSVIYPGESLYLLGYHRLITIDSTIEHAPLFSLIEENFDVSTIKRAKAPEVKGQFAMYLDNQWWQLTCKNTQDDKLDIEIVHDQIISQFFGITDLRGDERIQFVGGFDAINKIQANVLSPNQIGFMVCPVQVEEIIKTADDGQVLPPKSTYFEPKLLDGFLLQPE